MLIVVHYYPFQMDYLLFFAYHLKMGCDGGEVEEEIICLFNMWATIPRSTVSD